jgi:septal ring factor EnvC (AmiA/AmiB activator)
LQEILVVKIENQLMQANRNVEHQKGTNEQTRFVLEELKKQVETAENDLKKLESDLYHSKSEVLKKEGAVDSLLKKLEQLTTKTGVHVN